MSMIKSHDCKMCGSPLVIDLDNQVYRCNFCGISYDYEYFREDDVNGLENAKLIECGYGSFEDDECFIYVTVETTGADNTVTTSSFYVVIVSEQDTWLIDRFQTER